MRISALEWVTVLTEDGNVSEHWTGERSTSPKSASTVTGNQGPGTLVNELIEDVLQRQGTMHQHQVITLEELPGEISFAEASHYDHVHIGYRPMGAGGRWNAVRGAAQTEPVGTPDQPAWARSKTRRCRSSLRSTRCRPAKTDSARSGPRAAHQRGED